MFKCGKEPVCAEVKLRDQALSCIDNAALPSKPFDAASRGLLVGLLQAIEQGVIGAAEHHAAIEGGALGLAAQCALQCMQEHQFAC